MSNKRHRRTTLPLDVKPCSFCPHPWADHIFGAAGIWWCPVRDCPCKGTFDPEGGDAE